MRAVLDVNVIVSALLSSTGTPAALVRAWVSGEFELVVSRRLLDELARVLAYPKIRERVSPEDARSLVRWLDESATVSDDPAGPPPVSSPDPGDDYLIALASYANAALVTGDDHLLAIGGALPVLSPAAFRALLAER